MTGPRGLSLTAAAGSGAGSQPVPNRPPFSTDYQRRTHTMEINWTEDLGPAYVATRRPWGAWLIEPREDTIPVPLRLLRALHKALQDDRRAWFLNQESPFPLCPICHPVEAAEAAC